MKKMRFLLLCCIYSIHSFSQINEKFIFQDEFNDNSNYWDLYNDAGKVSSGLSFGSLHMDNKDEMGREVSISIPIDQNYDFLIVTDAQHDSGVTGNPFGLYFGGTDLLNSYCFGIADGQCILFKLENGKNETLIDWTKSAAIHTSNGFGNIIMLQQKKDKWTFYADGIEIASCKAQPFFGNKVGFYVENKQQVSFGHLFVKVFYPLINVSGTACEMFPQIRAQAKTLFKTITTSNLISKANSTQLPRYASSMIVTDALLNYIDSSRIPFYISRLGSYDTKEAAIKKMDSLSIQLGSCLKDYMLTKSIDRSVDLPLYTINEKTNGGFIDEANSISIRKDTRANKFYVELMISSWKGITRNYISAKADNSILAGQLKQLITYATGQFKKIQGAFVPSRNIDTAYFKQYKTTFKLEGSTINYTENDHNVISYTAVYGDQLNEKDATTLSNSLFEKLKKALGSEMVYSIKEEQEIYNKSNKEIFFINKNDGNDSRSIISRKVKISGDKELSRVEIRAVNNSGVRY